MPPDVARADDSDGLTAEQPAHGTIVQLPPIFTLLHRTVDIVQVPQAKEGLADHELRDRIRDDRRGV